MRQPGSIASGWDLIPYIELAIGCYFALTIWYAMANENYFTVPFLFLFVWGYWYTGIMSLLQGRFDAFGQSARGRGAQRETVSGGSVGRHLASW